VKLKKKPASAYNGALVQIPESSTPFENIVYSYKGVGWKNEDFSGLLVFQALVGMYDRSMNSLNSLNSSHLIFKEIHEKELAFKVSPFTTTYHDVGLFGVIVMAPQDTFHNLTQLLLNSYPKLGMEATEQQIERAKTKVKMSLLNTMDGTSPICEELARSVIVIGKPQTLEEIFQSINRVTKDQILEIGKKYCQNVQPAIGIKGKVLKNLPDFNTICSWTNA